ncbi:TetR family transcriptional regulator C-terminal domain-containing protein [Paenibacillus sp. P26]|nr:TetR family transcriptional regulator C-terminal domain-containing protein [Paenibacillus sp. P26]UUZ96313.1 TetR family transcriptional regulator C-terminal domain-containing protein [Paenibacillus sp. P25]
MIEKKTTSVKVFEHIADNRRLYRVLLSERGAAMIVVKLRQFLIRLAERSVIAQYVQHFIIPLPSELLSSSREGLC